VNTAFDEFLAVASELIEAAQRQSDSAAAEAFYRRSISTAYYALFHRLTDDVATLVIGYLPAQRQIAFKRSIRHGTFKGLRDELADQYREADHAGFHDRQSVLSGLMELCADLLQLQNSREMADYDPRIEDPRTTAEEALRSSREALQAWKGMPEDAKALFAQSLLWHFNLNQKGKSP
jgi:uncharacterized protein (UPF0332 family)